MYPMPSLITLVRDWQYTRHFANRVIIHYLMIGLFSEIYIIMQMPYLCGIACWFEATKVALQYVAMLSAINSCNIVSVFISNHKNCNINMV